MMRNFMKIVENMVPTLYHGSRKEFPIGFTLLPQEDSYVVSDDHDEQHHMLERAMEKYRPSHCISRHKAVYLIADPEDIDNAGGYNDHVYECEPLGPVTKCNLHWYSEAYMLCEHEVLSAQEAADQGMDHYAEYGEEPELKEYCLNYWNAVPQGGNDLFEYLTPRARVLKVV